MNRWEREQGVAEFMMEADELFEHMRKAAMASAGPSPLAHVRKLNAARAVAAALAAKRAHMRFPPEELAADVEPHYHRLLALIERQAALLESLQRQHDETEAARAHGREVARTNQRVHLAKLATAIDEEEERHRGARQGPDEDTRHERRMTELALKTEAAMRQLELIERGATSAAPSSGDPVEGQDGSVEGEPDVG